MELANSFKPQNLCSGRVHEVSGTSMFSFAAMIAASCSDPVIWIEDAVMPERLCPNGLAAYFEPARLVMIRPTDGKEALWCMEKSLRATPSLVVASLGKAASLTESRRLQLAAETGKSVGLCMVSDTTTSYAAETRWRSTAVSCPEQRSVHHWELLKNKKGILGQWRVTWDEATHALSVVSTSGGRTRNAQQSLDKSPSIIRSGRDAEKRLAALLDQ